MRVPTNRMVWEFLADYGVSIAALIAILWIGTGLVNRATEAMKSVCVMENIQEGQEFTLDGDTYTITDYTNYRSLAEIHVEYSKK